MSDKCEVNLGPDRCIVYFWYEALFDFVSTHPHQLSFHQGDKFELLSLVTESEAWWRVQAADGTVGLVAGNFVQLLDSQSQRLEDDSVMLISGTISTCEGELRYPDGSVRRLDGTMEMMYGSGQLEEPEMGVRLLDETWLLEGGHFQYPSGAVSTHEGLLRMRDGSLRAPEWELPLTARGRPQRIFASLVAEASQLLAKQNAAPVMLPAKTPASPALPSILPEHNISPLPHPETPPQQRRGSGRESLLMVTPSSDVALHVLQASLEQHHKGFQGTPAPDVTMHVVQSTPSVNQVGTPQPDVTMHIVQGTPSVHYKGPRANRESSLASQGQLTIPRSSGKHDPKFDYWYEAVYDWQPQKPKQLQAKKRDRLEVLDKGGGNPGWWRVRNVRGETGYLPFNYIQLFGSEAKSSVGGGRNLLLPSGTISTRKGVIRYPDGSVSTPEGAVQTDKGLKTWDDLLQLADAGGGELLLDGTILFPDGSFQFPSGVKAGANGQLATEQGGERGGQSEASKLRWQKFETHEKSPSHDIPPTENVSGEWKQHQYYLRVLFTFNPTEKAQLSIVKGEKLVLMTKQTNHVGWWMVENESGGTGLIPCNFTQLSCQGAMNTFTSGALLLRSGAISLKNGIIRYPDGSVLKPQHRGEPAPLSAGLVRLPDGVIRLPTGAVQYPSGATTNADGLLVLGNKMKRPRWKLPASCLPAHSGIEGFDAVKDFKAHSGSQLSFSKGDHLEVLNKITKNNGWWRARKADGSEGVVPCNYLVKTGSPMKRETPKSEIRAALDPPQATGKDRLKVNYFYEAMFEFKGEKGQLSYLMGDQLTLISKTALRNHMSEGWWLMQLQKTREVSRVAFSYVRLSASHAEHLTQNEALLPSGAVSAWLKTGPIIRYPDGSVFSQETGQYTLNDTILSPPDPAYMLPDGCVWAGGMIKYPSGAVALPNGQLRYDSHDAEPLWPLPNLAHFDFAQPPTTKALLPVEKIDYFYTAVWDNDAENKKQMSYRAGDHLELVNKEALASLPGWWLCQDSHGGEGLVAHNFVRLDCDGAVVLEDEADPNIPDVLLLRTGCRSRVPDEEQGGVAIEYPDGSLRCADDTLRLPDSRTIPGSESRAFLARGGGNELPDGCFSLADGAIRYPSGAVSTSDGSLQAPDGTIIDPLWPLNTYCDALLLPRNPPKHLPEGDAAKAIQEVSSGKRLSQYLKIKPNCYYYESVTEFKGDETMLTLRQGQRLVLIAKRTDRMWQMGTVDGLEGRVNFASVQLMYSGIERDAQNSVLLPTGVISEAGKLRFPDSWEMKENEGVFYKPDGGAVPNTYEAPPGTVTLLDGVVMLPDGSLRYPSGAIAKTDGSIVGGRHFGPVPVFARDRQPPRRIWQASGAYMCDDTYHYPDGSTMRFGEVVLPSGLSVVQEVLSATSEGGTVLEDKTVRLSSGAIRMPSGAITTALGQLRSRSGTLYPPKWPLPQSALPSVEAEELALRLLPILEKGIHHFAQLGDNDTVLRLLHRGISPNRRDELNNTPLHMTQHFGTAKTLISHGARNLKNSLGLKATHWCTSLEMKKELKAFKMAYEDLPIVAGDAQFSPKVSKKTKQSYCWACGLPFGATRAQRRCHRCGDAVCEMCSRLRFYQPDDTNKRPQRACDSCYNILSFAAASRAQHPPEQHQGPKEIVELKLSCNRLVSHARPSCPLVAVFIRMSSGKYKMVGQTECKIPTRQRKPLQLTFGPREERKVQKEAVVSTKGSKERLIVFDRVLFLDYWPLEDSEMKLAVYETDSMKLTERNLIGECGISIREAVRLTRQAGDVKLELTNRGNKKMASKMKRENSTLTLIARQLERTNQEDVIVMARQVHKPDLSGSVGNFLAGEGGDCTVRLELEVVCTDLVEGNRRHQPMVLCAMQPTDQPTLPWSRLQLVWEPSESRREGEFEFAKKCSVFHTYPCNKLLRFEIFDGRSDMKEWVFIGSATTSVYELAGEPNITHVFRVLDDDHTMTGELSIGVQVSGMVDIAACCRNLPKGNAVVATYDGAEFIAHTECATDSTNPSFLQKIRLEMTPDRYVTFSVFHVKTPKKIKLKNMIGSVVVRVADILARTGMFFVYQLETKIEQIPPAVLELRASFLGIPPMTLLPEHDPPPFRGSLQKQNGGQYKAWKWRYFVLEAGHLAYYPSETAQDKKPKLLFSVLGAKVDMTDVVTSRDTGYQFNIVPLKYLPVVDSVERSPTMQEQDKPNVDSDRVYHFQAREEHDRRKWLAALLQHGSHLQVLRNSKSHELPCAYQVAASWLATRD